MKDYYTVVASLPFLPYFAAAERLPLTRLRLEQRLRMLAAEETRQVYLAENLAGWRLSPDTFSSGRNSVAHLIKALQRIEQPALREFATDRLEIQTVLAALRLRQAGRHPKQRLETWGIGRWVKYIEVHWEAADFRLSSIYPWLPEAAELMAASDVAALERLLMDAVWRRLSRLADANPFGFEAITAFVFKWDILQAWLLRDAGAAQQRFQQLIDEVEHGH
ncbi:MAG: DUF2764 family protein [Gammaproteobacteria bacterium]